MLNNPSFYYSLLSSCPLLYPSFINQQVIIVTLFNLIFTIRITSLFLLIKNTNSENK